MRKKLGRRLCIGLLACFLVFSGAASAAIRASAVSLPIIMYHHINPDPASWGAWTIPPEMLREDLAYLREQGYATVTPDLLWAAYQGKAVLPEKPIMITFDDGNESFIAYALPLLEEFQMTAVFSVVGQYADYYTEHEDHGLDHSYCSWPALAEIQSSTAVVLGSHTYGLHGEGGCIIQPGQPAEEYQVAFHGDCAEEEARFSAYLGEKPTVFAYPSGLYCDEAREVLRQRGYRVLFTTDQKVNRLFGDPEELMDLGRFNRGYSLDRTQFFQRLGR